jgi:hypothetical protein
MPSEDVIAVVKAEGIEAFEQGMRRARGATEEAGTGAQTSGGRFGAMAKDLAVAAGGAAVIRKGFGFLKGAADDASALAKQTAGLVRQTGMDTRVASAWVSMAKQRGIESKGLTTSFTAFSKQINSAIQGSKGAGQALSTLGVDVEGLKSGTNDMQGALMQVSDSFAAMPDGPEKAALAVKAFGRQGLSLLPILNNGSGALDEQMDAMQRAGLTMDKDGSAKALALAKSQREMQTAMAGVKQQIGQALIPIISELAQKILPVIQGFATLINKSPILAGAVIGLGTAFAGILVLNKINSAITTFGQGLGMLEGKTFAQAAASKFAAAMQWIWNASLFGCPLLLIVAGLAAIVAGLVIAYKNVGWFRDIVDSAFSFVLNIITTVWNWIKSNWPLLLGILTGPFGTAVILIVQNWGKIKTFFSNLPGQVAGFLSSLPGRVANVFKQAASWAWRQFQWLLDRIKELPGKALEAIGNLGSQIADRITGGLGSAANALNPLNWFGTGGIVAAASGALAHGTTIVGERGPELAQYPSGTRITPLPPPMLSPSQIGGGGGGRPLVTQVFLDRRMIAEAMASEAADRQAAR